MRGGRGGGRAGPCDGSRLGLGLSMPSCPHARVGELALGPQSPDSPGARTGAATPVRADRRPLPRTDIVNKDSRSTLRVLYSLFCKHKLKDGTDRGPRGPPS